MKTWLWLVMWERSVPRKPPDGRRRFPGPGGTHDHSEIVLADVNIYPVKDCCRHAALGKRLADRNMIQEEMLRQMKEILREKGLDYVQFYIQFVMTRTTFSSTSPCSTSSAKILMAEG